MLLFSGFPASNESPELDTSRKYPSVPLLVEELYNPIPANVELDDDSRILSFAPTLVGLNPTDCLNPVKNC